jgi:hypothetical protein
MAIAQGGATRLTIRAGGIGLVDIARVVEVDTDIDIVPRRSMFGTVRCMQIGLNNLSIGDGESRSVILHHNLPINLFSP